MDYKKIFQMFILGTGELSKALGLGLGGTILFSKDIQDENATKELIKQIKMEALIPPFISIDQEGGRVERTENIYPRRLSPKFAYEKGVEFLSLQASEIATELNSLGFNLNFAPCADVNTNPDNPIIGERAFSNNIPEVIEGVQIVSNIHKGCGIIPCVKHFPGHGDANNDSHLTLPKINLTLQEMENIHIKPFKHAIQDDIDMVMIAHLHCECFDKERIPTSLSHNAISYLRNDLGFNGVIISDDMKMKGIELELKDALIKGVEAGLDMFIYRESDDMVMNAIENLIFRAEKDINFRNKIESSYAKIISLKEKYGFIK